jgi:succinyl-diaminopimelate desuccinylase
MKELLKKLVRAETTAAKGELEAAKIIAAEFSRSAIKARIVSWDKTRANVVVRVKSGGHKKAILFACHLDVVGAGEEKWKTPPFGGVERGGRIYGRGSADMKGGITAAVTAIRQIVESSVKLQGNIIFLAAAGEETDSCGTKRFIRNRGWMPELAGVVIPEPTDFAVVTAHRGMLWLEVTTIGKAAHSSTPQLGINAIGLMQLVLDELKRYKIAFKPHKRLGDCSMSINTITGGKALNVVPDRCSIGIDIRTLPSQNHKDIISDIEKIFAKLKSKTPQFNSEVSIVREVRALETDSRSEFVRDFCDAVGTKKTKAVGFTTDGPYFASPGVPVVIFGPGEPEVCHKSNEYIEISAVEKAVEHYKKIILKFLG